MSVVFVKERTTDNHERFTENRASNLSLILLEGGASVDNFSLELTVGETWSESYGPTSSQMQIIPADGLEIDRHGSIVVEVTEKIKIPYNMYGVVVPTGSLFLDRGVLIAPAKVEPSFSGKLKLRLFNTTSFRHTIPKGGKLASIVFFSTEITRFQPEVTKNGIAVHTPVPMLKKVKLWLRANANQVVTWSIAVICSSLMSVALSRYVFPVNATAAPVAAATK